MPTRKFPSAGYRVHFDRLRNIRAQTSATRTHKFLCDIPASGAESLKKKFEAAGKVVNGSERGTILWFLVQMLGLGFLVASKPERKRELLRVLDPDFSSPSGQIAQLLQESDSQYAQKVKSPEKLLDYLLKDKRHAYEQYQSWCDDNKRVDSNKVPTFVEDTLAIFGFSDVGELQRDEIWDALFAQRIFPLLNSQEENKFGLKLRRVYSDFFGVSELGEIRKEDTVTFFFNPLCWGNNTQPIPNTDYSTNALNVQRVLFDWVFPSADYLHQRGLSKDFETAVKEISGTANKQGGLSHFLNLALDQFHKGVDQTRELISRQNPVFFSRRTDLLDTLATIVHELASALSPAETSDFVKGNWGEYRSLVGGRLEGWISNFQNRLQEFQSILADDIHEKELKKWQVPDSVRDALLDKNEEGNFVFKPNLKDVEKQVYDGKKLQDYYFWGKGKEKGLFGQRWSSIAQCATDVLKKIREGTDFERVFPASFRHDFTSLQDLQKPLLRKLRATVLGVQEDHPDPRSLATMIEEYCTYWQPVNEFLVKWANEGIPEQLRGEGMDDEEETLQIWDDTVKHPDEKPSGPWIAKSLLASLLADQKRANKDEDDDQEDVESEEKIIGKLRKSLIPKELPKYPRFIGQAMKDPEEELKKAAGELPLVVETAEQFCAAVERQKDAGWEDHNWLVTQKKKGGDWKTVWHFGQLHKSLEALKKIAARSHRPQHILAFLNSFVVDADETFLNALQDVRGQKAGFDLMEERLKITEVQVKWMGLIKGDDLSPERIASFHFFLSGKEYGFARYVAVPIRSVSFPEFLDRFEQHFHLVRGQGRERFLSFLQIEDNGVGADAPTQAELLKFWWARRMMGIKENVDIASFALDPFLHDKPLSSLVLGQNGISRYAAARFLQAGLGATLRGDIGLLTRKIFVDRTVLQITSGQQTQIEYVPREWGFAIGGGEEDIKARRMYQTRLERRLMRIRNNIAALPEGGALITDLEEKADTLKQRLLAVTSGTLGFSPKVTDILTKENLSGTNKEIATTIWEMGLDNNSDLSRVLAEMPHSWRMVLVTKQEIQGLKKVDDDILVLAKDQGGTFGIHDNKVCKKTKSSKTEFLYSFPIRTSSVQKQFLERFLWGDREGVLTEKIMGPSVILETEKRVGFVNRKPKLHNGETKLFVAIPFELLKEKDKVYDRKKRRSVTLPVEEKRDLGGVEILNKGGESQKKYRTERNILGIDLGEYVFGYAVLDVSVAMKMANGSVSDEGKTKLFVRSGFVPVPLLAKMREGAASWQDTQATGIFSRPTTYLANLRAQAAGTVRNQIHALTLKYDAVPVYEDSVDAFEEGGNRIQKLYKTLKTSDVRSGGTKADEDVRKHIWGITAGIGGVIGAAKTSQTCRKCGRCATQIVQNLTDPKLSVVNGKVVDEEVSCALPDGAYEKSEILRAIKKAQRVESGAERVARESGKPYRGRSAQFRCQICGHTADADEQAARNIALKYFFKLIASDEEKKKYTDEKTGNFSSLKYFLAKSREDTWNNT